MTRQERRFWSKVSFGDGCWLWTGATRNRYGVLQRGRKGEGLEYAHRLAYQLEVGPIADGLYVLHRCDVRLCVRPDHLFLGTHQDNMTDARVKGRWPRGAAWAAIHRAFSA